MKSKAFAAIVFAIFAIAVVAYLVSTGASLPQRLATHFDWHGQPNGWMSRPSYLRVFGLTGLGVPLLMIALLFAVRFFPAWMINIPRREYWLAPERRAQTFDCLLRWGLWFGCLFLAFLAAVHHLVVEANGRTPIAMPSGIGAICILFLMAVLASTAGLLMHFAKGTPPDPAGTAQPSGC